MNIIKLYYGEAAPKNFTGIVEIFDKTADSPYAKEWYQDGFYHRLDGPAIEYSYGTKIWYKEGLVHRLNGPAIENLNGTNSWYVNGNYFDYQWLKILVESSIFLGAEKGKYDLEWLRFMTERGIKEFPVISGMKEDKEFKELLEKLGKEIEATITCKQ